MKYPNVITVPTACIWQTEESAEVDGRNGDGHISADVLSMHYMQETKLN